MKLLAAIWVCMVCASIFAQEKPAQDQPDNRVHFACVSVTPKNFLKCQSTLGNSYLRIVAEDKRFTNAADFARAAKVGDTWWPVGNGKIVLTMAASDIRHDDNGYTLTGNVEIHTTTTSVFADNAVYHAYPEDIEAHGNVRVIPAPPAQPPVQ